MVASAYLKILGCGSIESDAKKKYWTPYKSQKLLEKPYLKK
jgi:hypothetical protein